jgi:mannose-6-phosphate isomerase
LTHIELIAARLRPLDGVAPTCQRCQWLQRKPATIWKANRADQSRAPARRRRETDSSQYQQVSPVKAAPQLLPPNQLEHFYRGGRRIAALRGGSASPGMSRPEEWLASMTTMSSSDTRGLSRLGDGSLLRDAVRADPEGWLGPAHVARFGASTELLVKLLDADQRLPVHLHPDRAFARAHLSAGHGKTEAWYVLSADPGATVRLGFTEPVTADRLRRLVADRDTDALVGALHRLTVAPGDAVLVPAGTPHSIDPGVFVIEQQEPTDFSILLEARDLPLDLDRDGHLGLGYDVALQAVDRAALTDEALAGLVRRGQKAGDLMPPGAAEFFRLHSAEPSYEPGFAVVVVIDGGGRFEADGAAPFDVQRGDAVVVPFAAGRWRIDGTAWALVSRPPRP